jgi:imidazolonepropionase-like amidohydrolase
MSHRRHTLSRVVSIAAGFLSAAAGACLAQYPANQLMSPPADAQKFVIVSAAGQHGTFAMWRTSAGETCFRESLLLRGMVWEQDEVVHFGPNGQPDRITIRGVTPTADAAESFTVVDGVARWKSPVDAGSKAYDGRSIYLTQGGPFAGIGVLAELLQSAPGHKVSLLPSGEARLTKLTDTIVGQGNTQRTVSAFGIEGLSLSPVPVWLDQDGRFFGSVSVLSVLPQAYAGEFLKLQKVQDEALAARNPALARRFGVVAVKPVAFTHVKMFDADAGRFLEDQTVVAEQGRITAVGPAASAKVPADAQTIDGRGRCLVPGLWDAHMHVTDDSTGPMLLSIGVTSARDPGADIAPTVGRAERIAKGELLFPTVYPSVLIDGKGPLAAQGGFSVTSATEALDGVRMAKKKGFTGVKFYGSMKPEWLVPAIAEAKKLGLHVHGHVPATMRPADAIAAGYEEITHINFVMMQAMPDEVVKESNGIMRFEGPGRFARNVNVDAEPLKSLIADMARKKIVVDPTLSTFELLYVPENGDLSPAYAPYMGTLPPATERSFRTGGFTVPKDLTRADYRASFRKMMLLAAALHRAKVPIVAGTDGSGLEIVRELELYVEAGLTPAEALQAATITPARLVEADAKTGSIKVGKEADLVLVDGDPSIRIGDLRHAVWVMSDGKLMNADELRAAVGFTGKPR